MTAPTADLQAILADRMASVIELDRWVNGQAEKSWRNLRPADLQGSFVDSVLPSLLPTVKRAQSAAADMGATSMARAIEAGGGSPPDLHVNPEGFSGFASDGGSLVSAIAAPLIETYVDLSAGMDTDEALKHSFDSLDRILTTQIHDSARSAEQVQMVADKEVTYYVRVVEPGACDRCIILAGKHYKYSAGFLRHENCRCSCTAHTAVDESQIASPRETFDQMTPEERFRAFGVANTKAIEAGANLYRVVNATGSKAGMTTTITDRFGRTLKATYVGAPKGRPRLVPEAILKLAGDDRALMIRLLRKNGYLTS